MRGSFLSMVYRALHLMASARGRARTGAGTPDMVVPRSGYKEAVWALLDDAPERRHRGIEPGGDALDRDVRDVD